VSATDALGFPTDSSVTLIDLREAAERARHGRIPGAVHLPYPELREGVSPGGVLHGLAAASGRRLVFYCAFGERSAMAVRAARDAGLSTAIHIHGGMAAWKAARGAVAV
jgi:rhodanese-related sulfurtransferase